MIRLLIAAGLLVGCGGDEPGDGSSGVAGDKRVVDLTSDELDTVCAYIAEISGPPQSFTCDGTTVISGITKERCVSNAPTAAAHPNCQLTVDQLEGCYEYTSAYKADPCKIPPSNACSPLAAPACN